MEACLELMAAGAVLSIQDMGAAGLTSSSVEMASKGGLGMELDLDLVPVREEKMSAYEIMLSESQERMLMVIDPSQADVARAIFEKWDLDFMPIGQVTDTGRLILLKDGETACDIPLAPLVDDAPEYDRPHKAGDLPLAITNSSLRQDMPLSVALKTLMGSVELSSRRWVYEQYDSHVMADTLIGPGSDAALVRVHGTRKALAVTTDCTPRYVHANPFEGGKQAVAEAYRNITASGAKPLAVTNNLNFGNPEKPEIMAQIVGSVQGMGAACEALETPVVSGNVSLYNETDGQAIHPCPVIGMVGLIDDYEQSVSMRLTEAGLTLMEVGPEAGDTGLSASVYAKLLAGTEDGAPPAVDLEAERAVGAFLRSQMAEGMIAAAHDIADGGLLVAVADMLIAGNVGAEMAVPDTDAHGWAFGEDQARYVVAVSDADTFIAAAEAASISVRPCGKTIAAAELKLADSDTISVEELSTAYEACLPDLMAAG